MINCKQCAHWIRLKESDNYLPEDENGRCDAIGSIIDISIDHSEWSGGASVENIETPFNFFCAGFDSKLVNKNET